MKKHKVKKVKGVKVVTEVRKKADRPAIPPGAVFDMKTKYDRQREKENLRKELNHSDDKD